MTNKNVKLTWGQLRDLFMAYNDIRTDTNNAPGTKPALYGVVVFKSSGQIRTTHWIVVVILWIVNRTRLTRTC